MTVWIGVDEAGYGPNLGPLVVCASVWSSPRPFKPENWVDELYPTLRRALQSPHASEPGIVIDDSKKVYQAGKGLEQLERSVLTLASLCGDRVADADALRNSLDSSYGLGDSQFRWRKGAAATLPITPGLQVAMEVVDLIGQSLRTSEVTVRQFAGRVLFPSEFNQRLAQSDNKAAVLSESTMQLVCGILTKLELPSDLSGRKSQDVVVLCDKHGGRDRYFALLTHFFPDEQIKILREGEAESAYKWTNEKGNIEIRFSAKAERFPPTAAASMMAKYVRELCMLEWNAFWSDRIPGLAPTAGYPVDAKRFRMAIENLATELGFSEADYWRRK